jgi:hypothetical protein
MAHNPEQDQPLSNYLRGLQSLPDNRWSHPKVTEIKTYRQAHHVTPDDFIDSGILAEVIELPIREEPDDIVA